MTSELSENVRQVLKKLLPASVLNEVACFVFYDEHPSDNKNIDVTICTKSGVVKEYYQRDLICSIKLPDILNATEIKIIRNSECELFYLVVAKESITILSRRDKLLIHQMVSNVARYDISDISCSGQANLRVFCTGDAVPLTFDDNFENYKCPDVSMAVSDEQNDDTLPLINHLKRKLSEAKYSVKFNEKTYKEFLDLHQSVAFSTYKKIHPNLDDSVFKNGTKEIASALRINTATPWIKVCNKKVVIVLNVCNLNNEHLEDVHILIHSQTGIQENTTKNILHSIEYTTKIFEKTATSPFWEEKKTQTIRKNIDSAIVAVIDLEELKSSVISRIEFNAIVFYKKYGKEFLLPIEDVYLSSLDTMGEEFDVFSSEPMDSNILLAILATTTKTELIARHIKKDNDEPLSLDVFCKYLKMEQLPHCDNVAIYRKNPYHILNGIMLVMNNEGIHGIASQTLSVYSRTASQVLAFIHYIQDAVPLTIVITTPNYRITAKDNKLSHYNEEMTENSQLSYNYQNYGTSILNRSKLVLKYLDQCMMKMGESKDTLVQSKIGSEIDLFAGGESSYMDFKNRMREEAASVKMFNDDVGHSPESDDVMCID
uniref:Uncharacterized protein n=1 Tax=Heliothis virescens TaxID=7102 RepID=A0A2A4J5I0_HELVI